MSPSRAAPNDGWALYGPKMTETKLGNMAEEATVDAVLKRMWTGAAGVAEDAVVVGSRLAI